MRGRTHTLPVDALPLLREKGLKKYAEVVTNDGHPLGIAMRFFHRPPAEVNNEQRLYATYLEITSVELGGPIFVPTEYVADYDPRNKRATLAVDFHSVNEEMWNRTPDFIARGQGAVEELPG